MTYHRMGRELQGVTTLCLLTLEGGAPIFLEYNHLPIAMQRRRCSVWTSERAGLAGNTRRT